ncbi:MAG: hypothetical protein LN415_06170 [Candidatus Thermoplasmatota archaeon]|nr:hypothetical protein [Candidatus Thermoplasmatota archaeon]
MKEFKVYSDNKRGELARIAEALAQSSVNIEAIASENSHPDAFLRIVTNDVNTTKRALSRAGYKYDEKNIIVLDLIDRPGELAKLAKRMTRAGVNIESIYLLEKAKVALAVDDLKKAMKVIKEKYKSFK